MAPAIDDDPSDAAMPSPLIPDDVLDRLITNGAPPPRLSWWQQVTLIGLPRLDLPPPRQAVLPMLILSGIILFQTALPRPVPPTPPASPGIPMQPHSTPAPIATAPAPAPNRQQPPSSHADYRLEPRPGTEGLPPMARMPVLPQFTKDFPTQFSAIHLPEETLIVDIRTFLKLPDDTAEPIVMAALSDLVGEAVGANQTATRAAFLRAKNKARRMRAFAGHAPLPANTPAHILALLTKDDVATLVLTLNTLIGDDAPHSFTMPLRTPNAFLDGVTTPATGTDAGRCLSYQLAFRRKSFSAGLQSRACRVDGHWTFASAAREGTTP